MKLSPNTVMGITLLSLLVITGTIVADISIAYNAKAAPNVAEANAQKRNTMITRLLRTGSLLTIIALLARASDRTAGQCAIAAAVLAIPTLQYAGIH